MAKEFQHVRGMPDILPDEQRRFNRLIEIFQNLADDAGFSPVDMPMLEEKEVFVRGVGTGTDVVDKEMYTFTDRSGNELALRPEPTAGIVRAYVEHGMASWPQPVKLAIAGPMFRYDRPQAGRRRQFHQVGVEVIGDASASIDAHIIALAMRFFRTVGLHRVTVQVNSIGDSDDRKRYRQALVEYLDQHHEGLAEIDRERIKTNPLRVLDSKERESQKTIHGAPKLNEYLSDSSRQHYEQVLEYLHVLGVKYQQNPLLVRGLDYYTHTVFEFVGEREGRQNSLGGGGRYDGLVELLGGQSTSAAGFGLGLERILLEQDEEQIKTESVQPVSVYIASLGEPARLAAFKLIEQLLDAGVGAIGAVERDGIGSQLDRANKLNIPHAVIIGQKEVKEATVILRDMKTGVQEMIPLKSVIKELQQRFGSSSKA